MRTHPNTPRKTVYKLFWSALFLTALSAQAQTTVGNEWRYTVRPQDTIFSLTRQYLKPSVKWQTLAEYNQLADANVIYAGTQLRIPLRWLSVAQASAQLIARSGEVQVQMLDGQWRDARLNESLQTGQQLRVGHNSSARLKFADESTLVIQPESSVSMDTMSVYAGGFMADTRLRLQAGRVEVQANPKGLKGPKFDVITPAAVATVRGTQFIVEAQPERTLEQTTQGMVTLKTTQGNVLVGEGYGSTAKPGEKPKAPEAVKPAPQLMDPSSQFTDFPIAFRWANQADASHWVVQTGRDPLMTEVITSVKTATTQTDVGVLDNGKYYLRLWSADNEAIPSKTALHAFEVAIPRTLQSAAVTIPSEYFSAGPLALQLATLPANQRYLLQLTEDAAGRKPVWSQANVQLPYKLPVPADNKRTHYLWIYIY